jgi:hypothetical protein
MSYRDPRSPVIGDWKWRSLKKVRDELSLDEIPSHVEKFGEFMNETARRAAEQGLSPRDLVKAYTLTRFSIQRTARKALILRKAGLLLPPSVDDNDRVRPEGAFGHWLHTKMGQQYLDNAEAGRVDEEAIHDAQQKLRTYGKVDKDMPDALRWAPKNLPGQEGRVSELVRRSMKGQSDPSEWRDEMRGLKGIRSAKAGFLAAQLGRGDQPTLDARQLILNTGEPSKASSPYLRRQAGQGATEAVKRLAGRQSAMDLSLPKDLAPHYQHLAHHAIWDAAEGEKTTHQDVIDALRTAKRGGRIARAVGGRGGRPEIPLQEHLLRAMEMAGFGRDAEKLRDRDPQAVMQALEKIHTPFSDSPESREKAKGIVNAYRVTTNPRIVDENRYYGIQHAIAPKDVTETIKPIRGVVPKDKITRPWQHLYTEGKGGTLIGLGGDRTRQGVLTHINGKKLAWPVRLDAGMDYMRELNPGAVWKSAPGATTKLQNKIREAAKTGPVYGAFAPMGATSGDSSVHMFETMMAQMPGSGMSATTKTAFDRSLKRGEHVPIVESKANSKEQRAKAIDIMKKWPGLDNPREAAKFAAGLSGEHRATIIKHMDNKEWHRRGMPHVGITRVAITEPELRETPGNTIGPRIVRFDPDRIAEETRLKHGTYRGAAPIAGSYWGDTAPLQSHHVMSDPVFERMMTPTGKKAPVIAHPFSADAYGRGTWDKIRQLHNPVQKITPQWADEVGAAEEQHAKYGFASGGRVGSDEHRKWFGKSKVVDEKGKPLTVYHATNYKKSIHKFRTPAYFSNSPSFAGKFGESSVYPVHLRLENPHIIDAATAGRHFEWDADDVADMKKQGHDGVHVVGDKSKGDADIYTVFDPDQVRSTITGRAAGGRVARAMGGPIDDETRQWFGNSKVVDEKGEPLVVYRGEYGEENPDSTTFHTRMPGSISFGSKEAANTYATEPNSRNKYIDAPRVTPAYLKIENPVINSPDDPFVELGDIEKKLGRLEARRLARKHAYHVTNTSNWHEHVNADNKYDSVDDFLKKNPDGHRQLYLDAYPVLDDPKFVRAAVKAGYDGAIHNGNNVTAMEKEYRLFHPQHARSAISPKLTWKKRADGGPVQAPPPMGHNQPPEPTAPAAPVDDYQRQVNPLGLYSHAAEAVWKQPQMKASPAQFKSTLINKHNVKPDEFKWSNYDRAFAGRDMVTKREVRDHFLQNMPGVEEKQYQEGRYDRMGDDGEEGGVKYSDYQLPGGQNYREVVLHMPHKGLTREELSEADRLQKRQATLTPEESDRLADITRRFDASHEGYKSSHWDEKNALLHLRMSDRAGPMVVKYAWQNKLSGNRTKTFNSEEEARAHLATLPAKLHAGLELKKVRKPLKVLHVEELQSDWGQAARDHGIASGADRPPPHEIREINFEGRPAFGVFVNGQRRMAYYDREQAERYASELTTPAEKNGVPPAPYIDNTGKWTELGLKRVLHEAAKGGYDRIVFTPGEEQAKRYDLSKQVKEIHYSSDNNALVAYDHKGGMPINEGNVTPEDLHKYVGREVAEKLMHPDNKLPSTGTHILGGDDLKVGGEGMKGYYDKIVPRALEKLAKQHDPAAEVKLHAHPVKGHDKYTLSFTNRGGVLSNLRVRDIEKDEYVTPVTQDEKKARAQMAELEAKAVPKLHALDLTPKMKASILKGQRAYASGGAVTDPTPVPPPAPVDDYQRELSPIGLYSHAAEAVWKQPQMKASPAQFKSTLINKHGVKPDEFKWTGYDQAFAGRDFVTKKEVRDHFLNNMPKLEETTLGSTEPMRSRGVNDFGNIGPAKYEGYQLPEGENYREVVTHMPIEHDMTTQELKNAMTAAMARRSEAAKAKVRAAARHKHEQSDASHDAFVAASREHTAATDQLAETTDELRAYENSVSYKSGHWDQRNPLFHLRMSDRTGPNGEKILHVEEIQSDWGQEGRDKGFRKPPLTKDEIEHEHVTPQQAEEDLGAGIIKDHAVPWRKENGLADDAPYTRHRMKGQKDWHYAFAPLSLDDIHAKALKESPDDRFGGAYSDRNREAKYGTPRAPFIESTEKWTDLALKRVLHEAAAGNYQKIVFTRGKDQADRYDLSKQISRIVAHKRALNDFHEIWAFDKNENQVHYGNHQPKDLPGVIGHELAERVMKEAEPDQTKTYSGMDLKVGGEGMNGYYDKIVPKRLEKLARMHDPKAEVKLGGFKLKKPPEGASGTEVMNELGVDPDAQDTYWRALTPEMREQHFAEHFRRKSGDSYSLHELDVTPAMRASIRRGQRSFADGGRVGERISENFHRKIRRVIDVAGRYAEGGEA